MSEYRKMTKRIIAVFLAVLMLSSALVSCKSIGETETTETVYYTVTFNSNGGSEVKQQIVASGAKVSVPVTPEYTNYVFREWRYNGKAWNFEYDTVKSDMTLVAEWISAENLFAYAPTEETENALITGFKEGFSPLPESVTLPKTINGLNVTGVGDGAFKDTSSEDVAAITLPSTIVSVGNEAFDGCAGITITVKGALTYVGERAFGSCDGLSEVTFGEGLEEITPEAFIESGIKRAVLPKSLKLIDEDAFKSCASLTVIVISPMNNDTDTVIGNSAFRDCEALKTVFFRGTDAELDALIDRTANGNDAFIDAKLCIYSETEPTENGNFWYTVDGEPREW